MEKLNEVEFLNFLLRQKKYLSCSDIMTAAAADKIPLSLSYVYRFILKLKNTPGYTVEAKQVRAGKTFTSAYKFRKKTLTEIKRQKNGY